MRSLGEKVFQAQYGVGEVVGINTDGESGPGTLYRVEFISGAEKIIPDKELFDNRLAFEERNAADYHR